MNFKKIVYLPLCFFSTFCMANVALDVDINSNDQQANFKGIEASETKKGIVNLGQIEIEINVLTETDTEAEIELIISKDGEVTSKPRFNVFFGEAFQITFEVDGDVFELLAIANKIG